MLIIYFDTNINSLIKILLELANLNNNNMIRNFISFGIGLAAIKGYDFYQQYTGVTRNYDGHAFQN